MRRDKLVSVETTDQAGKTEAGKTEAGKTEAGKTEVEEFIEREAHIPGFLERVMLADDPLTAQFQLSGGLEGIRSNQRLRERVLERFGYAVLTQAVVDRLIQYGPYVEIGAGTGYWSYELRKAGCRSVATDLHTPETKGQPDILHPFHGRKRYVEVLAMSAEEAIALYPKNTLLMVWPDLDCNWAWSALEKYTGNTLVYVGEGRGGWTGDDQLHDRLERMWKVDERIRIPCFPVHSDAVFLYRRRLRDEYEVIKSGATHGARRKGRIGAGFRRFSTAPWGFQQTTKGCSEARGLLVFTLLQR